MRKDNKVIRVDFKKARKKKNKLPNSFYEDYLPLAFLFLLMGGLVYVIIHAL